MAAKKPVTDDPASQPFGAGALETGPLERKHARKQRPNDEDPRAKASEEDGVGVPRREAGAPEGPVEARIEGRTPRNRSADRQKHADEAGEQPHESARQAKRRRWKERRNRRRRRRGGGGDPEGNGQLAAPREAPEPSHAPERAQEREPEPQVSRDAVGLLFLELANHGHLRTKESSYLPSKQDVHVAPRLVQKYGLREGSILEGPVRRGQGRHKWELADVRLVDGRDPAAVRNLTPFKNLTSIDPDFHYAVGDVSGETSMKVVDLLCPVGRGQRGLIVAPPRSGKTILLRQFAAAIEKGYPEVHLMVLLVDERPEEATEWQRTIERGEVFVSTNDEMAKKHVELAEAVWRRCRRLVELGEEVILLLDSITRLGRAYNNVKGDSGRTMSGGLDTRALERPKQFFGSARNTETAGSLTILGTTLIETGSRMDQVIFEEFKGTGNMELVLSRKLADRRIFPAIDIVKTGTRKDEKLHSSRRLHRVNTLRRVLMRMHWAEAMELLSTKLDNVEKIDDFLERFEIDPES